MNKIFLTIAACFLLISCQTTKKATDKDNDIIQSPNSVTATEPQAKVVGVGGIFFYAENLEKTKAWYAKNLGIDTNDWGSSSFDSRDLHNPEQINSLQWKPFKQGDEYFSPSKKEFMINYQVQNIEGLVSKLKENGVTVLDNIEDYGYGKFVHILDEEGNKIELWEPVENGDSD